MLRTLYIRDYALISELDVEFEDGLNVLTGETGAGKSIIVGALNLILGDRASTDLVRSGSRKAVVEGIFEDTRSSELELILQAHDIEVGEGVILRREVTRSHSRAFVNDSPATLAVIREVAAHLIDLHGQHEHQSLLREKNHLQLLDSYGRLGGLLAEYEGLFAEMARLTKERSELAGQERRLQEQRERLAFEIEEIDEVAPEPQEQEALDAQLRILENAEWLYGATARLYEVLYATDRAVSDQLVVARNELQAIARVDPTFDAALEEIRSAQITVADVATQLQDYNARIEFDPDRLEIIRERQSQFERLKHRYGGTIEAVTQHRDEIGRLHSLALNFSSSLSELDSRIDAVQRALSQAALRLSTKRHEVAERLEGAIGAELAKLGMPDSRLNVDFRRRQDAEGWISLPVEGRAAERCAAFASGMDRVAFYVSANVGEKPKPLARVASGGEISRIMLALKAILAKTDRLPILVFDEIDRGISGRIARKVGESMWQLAQYHQIIAITHLPQIAALGNAHFSVEKTVEDGRAETHIRRLEEFERAAHIAALIVGTEITQATLESARELMASGGLPEGQPHAAA